MEGMTGEASWITAFILASGVFGVAALFAISKRIDRSIHTLREVVACPADGLMKPAEVLFDDTLGRRTAVKVCDGQPANCDHACIRGT